MPEINNKNVFNKVKQLICSTLLIISVIPGFNLIGNLFLQVVVTLLCVLVVNLISDKLIKADPEIISGSLELMLIFWIIAALCKQIYIHILTKDYSFRWLHLFYFDKPALIFIVFFISTLYYIFKLIKNKNNPKFIQSYKTFIRRTSLMFVIYYLIILTYSFFLVREITLVRPEYNLKPFEMIIFTFSRGYIDYELIFLFLGNVAIFLPLGVFASAFLKNKFILIILPIIISFTIEVSQYFLGNGHPDVDDFILNVLGFYLGIGIKKLLDLLVNKLTKGQLSSFFIF